MYDLKRECTVVWLVMSAIAGLLPAVSSVSATGMTGEAEFKEHCVACHADGGNIIRSDKTLSREDREKHGISTPMDIVKLMRNPGEGMTTFDKTMISDKEAMDIADFIIKTFK